MRSNETPGSTQNQDSATPTGRRLSRTRAAVVAGSAGSLVAVTALATLSLTAGPAGAATSGITGTLTSASAGAAASSTTGIPAGFPTGSNTGVQAGTVLKNVPSQVSSGPGWTWNPAGGGYADVTGNGANLSGLRIPGNVDISGNNVTLNNVSITVSGGGDSYGVDLRNTANVTIQHSSIQGTDLTTGRLGEGIKDIYGDATGTRVLNNNIQKTDTAVQIFQGTIQGNYIHNLGMISTDHVNGITTNGDTQPLLIQNNTILNKFGQTDAIGLFQDFGVVSNVTINHNLLAGGAYSLYGGEGSQGQSSNIKVTNNQFSTMYFKNGGAYGPVAYFDNQGPGNAWTGNTWTSGAAVPEP